MEMVLYTVYALFAVSVIIVKYKETEKTMEFASFCLISSVVCQLMFQLIGIAFVMDAYYYSYSLQDFLNHRILWDVEGDIIIAGSISLCFAVPFTIWYLRRYRGVGDNIFKFNVVLFAVSAGLERAVNYFFDLFPTTADKPQYLYAFAKIGILLAVMLLLKMPMDLIAEKLGWTDEKYHSTLGNRMADFFRAIGKKLSQVRVYAVIPLAIGGGIFYQMFTRLFTYLAVVKYTDYTFVDVSLAKDYTGGIKTCSIIEAAVAVVLLFVWYVNRLNFALGKRTGKNVLLFHIYQLGAMLIFALGAYVLLWLIPPARTRDGLSLQCALEWLVGVPVLLFATHRLFTALLEKIKYQIG